MTKVLWIPNEIVPLVIPENVEVRPSDKVLRIRIADKSKAAPVEATQSLRRRSRPDTRGVSRPKQSATRNQDSDK